MEELDFYYRLYWAIVETNISENKKQQEILNYND
jgi:hypothetical protein